MRRPLILVALLYVAGILLGSALSVPLEFVLSCAFAICVLALLWARVRAALLVVLCFLTGWVGETLHTTIISPSDLRQLIGVEPALATFRGTISQTPSHRVFVQGEKESWRTVCQLDVAWAHLNRGPWQPAVGRVNILTPALLTNYFTGQTVEISGVAHLPKVAVAEGTFDYRAYLKQQEIYYQLDASTEEDWKIIRSPSRKPLADRFRDWARPALARGLPVQDQSLELEWALTLGWKTALTEETAEPFVQAATYHIFAVDGLRMAIIFGIFFSLLRALRLPRAICALLLIPLIWFYTALTGWPASAVRATIMLTLVITGWVLKRPGNLINSLFAAALIILVWQPQQLFQAGFQLSFLVVLCIVIAMPLLRTGWDRLWALDPLLPESLQPPWRKVMRVPGRFVTDIVLTSFAAWIGSIPLVAYYFHIVTPVSAPANLLAVPLCALVLMSNLASLILMEWFPACGILFNHAGWFLMECIRNSSQWFAEWPHAYFYVSQPGFLSMGLYYSLLLVGFSGWFVRPKLRIGLAVSLGLMLALWGRQCWRESFMTRLHLLPVNGGMAVYFDSPGTKNDLLMDCGPTNGVSLITKPFLRAQGVNRLHDIVLTHGDVHHVGGAKLLVDLFSVKRVWVSPARFRSPVYRRLISELEATPGKTRALSRNEQLGLWTVLHPEADDHFPQADDNTLVFSSTIHGSRVLLVSDLGSLGQKTLLERSPDLKADIVITGLPTRPEPINDSFLEVVQPRLIIVVDSEYPVSERASPKLMARLARSNIPVLYTRIAGATTIEWDKSEWKLHTMEGTKMSSEVFSSKRQESGRF
jgi:competence protein ComEC